jgi:predicted permease
MLSIAWNVIAPIFAMMMVGFGVQKLIGLDTRSLTKLNFWIFVPAVLWVQITESKLSSRDMGIIATHFVIVFATMGLLTWQAARLCGANDRLRRALTASVLFYNSGNYGIPAAQFAFGAAAPFAVAVQSIVIMLQNVSNFSIGLSLHAGGREDSRLSKTLGAMFKLPMIYVLIAAWIWRGIAGATGATVPAPLDKSVHAIADGMVPVALVTLGAQMAALKSHRFDRFLGLALLLRLVAAPAFSWLVVWAMGIQGELAQSLIVSVSFPTAVNSALLAMEFDNEPDFAAATVFYSTIFSALTVSFFIFAARAAYP